MACRFRHDSRGRVLGRLDDVEVDAVGEEVAAAHQHDDVGLAASGGVAVGIEQPSALVGAHRAVVEVEVQVADAARAPRRRSRGTSAPPAAARAAAAGISGTSSSRPARRSARTAGSLNEPGALEVRDPDRPVDGRAADGPVSLGERARRGGRAARRSRWAPKRWNGIPSIVSSTPGWPSAARIRRRTVAVGIGVPVDRALGLTDQRPRAGR